MGTNVLAERISERLKALGITMRAASMEATGKPDAIRDILKKGQGVGATRLASIARVLETSAGYLLGETSDPRPSPAAVMADRATAYRSYPAGNTDKIPIMGIAEGGGDGWEHWNGEVVGFADRPANMMGVANAYAVYVINDSMSPRYMAGETVFVNPVKPVTPGSHILLQLKPTVEGDAPRAIIKKLVRISGTKVTLEQYNPARTFDVPRDQIVSMHRISASGE